MLSIFDVCGVECLYVRIAIVLFFFQAEDGIRDLVRSRGLGDVYKRQGIGCALGFLLGDKRIIDRLRDRLAVDGDECLALLSLIHI